MRAERGHHVRYISTSAVSPRLQRRSSSFIKTYKSLVVVVVCPVQSHTLVLSNLSNAEPSRRRRTSESTAIYVAVGVWTSRSAPTLYIWQPCAIQLHHVLLFAGVVVVVVLVVLYCHTAGDLGRQIDYTFDFWTSNIYAGDSPLILTNNFPCKRQHKKKQVLDSWGTTTAIRHLAAICTRTQQWT